MKSPFVWMALGAACFAFSCASPADRGVEGTLHSTIPDRHVDIDVDHGVVTLEGKVNTEADRQRIEALARQTPGVVAVKNKLEVKLPSPGVYGGIPGETTLRTAPPTAVVTEPPAPTAVPDAVVEVPSPTGPVGTPVVVPGTPHVIIQPAVSTDQVLANRLAQALGNASLATGELDSVTIAVKGGAVTVSGIVDSQSKKNSLLDLLKQTSGVSTVYDQLQVR